VIAAATSTTAAGCNPTTDQRGPAEYKRHLAGEMTARALRRAIARAHTIENGGAA
jgi:aerobic carbon-monoxide dehydrogenase medium subunit